LIAFSLGPRFQFVIQQIAQTDSLIPGQNAKNQCSHAGYFFPVQHKLKNPKGKQVTIKALDDFIVIRQTEGEANFLTTVHGKNDQVGISQSL